MTNHFEKDSILKLNFLIILFFEPFQSRERIIIKILSHFISILPIDNAYPNLNSVLFVITLHTTAEILHRIHKIDVKPLEI